jgi:regulation of enolase protein 1 (concanavalin A-like superfamily)
MGTAWQMPLAVIGKPTGDGRQFDAGALGHRDLPLPLRYVASDSGGHANAVIVGHIAKIGKEKGGMLPAQGEFQFQARVTGNYSQLYDQAGIMVRLDEKHWLKCGSEFFDGRRWASVVVTHEFSDWSTMEDLTQNGPVYWRVQRKKDSLEAQCSIDGEKFSTVRQAYFPAHVPVEVGVMCAAPEGRGFDSTFDQLEISQLK